MRKLNQVLVGKIIWFRLASDHVWLVSWDSLQNTHLLLVVWALPSYALARHTNQSCILSFKRRSNTICDSCETPLLLKIGSTYTRVAKVFRMRAVIIKAIGVQKKMVTILKFITKLSANRRPLLDVLCSLVQLKTNKKL